jgi:Tfp pilus assembly protein PilF
MRESAHAGLSRLLSQYAQAGGQLGAAEEAVRLAPEDPEAHYARAVLSADAGLRPEALASLERAVAARPRDYVLWLELGNALDRAGMRERALAAFDQAIRRAPFYAQPRWELGNILFRVGIRNRAFAELRQAASTDPVLLPGLLELAWQAHGGDARAAAAALRPDSAEARLALARFLMAKAKPAESLEWFRAAGGPSPEDRRAVIGRLLDDGQFEEAYTLWLDGGRAGTPAPREPDAGIYDGGFEQQRGLADEPGFGWRGARGAGAVRISTDRAGAKTGSGGIRLEWDGDSDPNAALLSQLVLVEPNARYRVGFAARTEQVVMGGLPELVVSDAGKSGRVLARGPSLPAGTNGWNDYAVEFTTGGETPAVLVSVRRSNCKAGPCPAFGRVWLDDFSLRKL